MSNEMRLSSLKICLIWLLISINMINAANYESCASLKLPDLPNMEVLSVSGVERRNHTVKRFKMPYVLDHDIHDLSFCNVTLRTARLGVPYPVTISVWLPLEGWNGRFISTGGGGWASGVFDPLLGQAIQAGFAAASTDGGHGFGGLGSDMSAEAWAIRPDGSINWDLLENFAGRSIHDLGIVGKAVTKAYYGIKPHHSYFHGCSNGGRQGYYLAQKYPGSYDGILANAPALNFPELQMVSFWPQVVMKEAGIFPSPCELDAFVEVALEQCDALDGVQDGVISNPAACEMDPFAAVGRTVDCNDSAGHHTIIINNATAAVVEKFLTGPTAPNGEQLFVGIPPSCSLTGFANTKLLPTGERVGAPFFVTSSWLKGFLQRDYSFDISTIGYEEYAWLFTQALLKYEWLLGTNNPDLSSLRDSGTKMLSWHGTIDDLIPYSSVVQYRQRVEALLGGTDAVDEFYRFFLAPGVKHCAFGNGPIPVNPLESLIAWVEEGVAPETIPAETMATGRLIRRNLCRYPKVSHYDGKHNPDEPESWICVETKQHELTKSSMWKTGLQAILSQKW